MSCRRPRPRLDIHAHQDVVSGQWVVWTRSGRALLRPGRHPRTGSKDGWTSETDQSF